MATEFDLLIRGGRVVTPGDVVEADIGVREGRIAKIGEIAATAQEIFNAQGKVVMPGGIDPHAHIEQVSGLGRMNADTWETGTRSAAMGGTTTVITFAAQQAGQPLAGVVSDYAGLARRGAMVDHAFHMIVSDTSVPDFARDLTALIAAGHRSIKVFTTYKIRIDDRDILDVMTLAKAGGALVCVHAENDGLISWTRDALVRAGLTQTEYHAVSHPRLAEIETVERMCRFSEFMDQPLMLFHISTAEAVAAIRAARARGLPVWAETCPHYLFMTADVLKRDGVEGAKWICSPPQRTGADQQALWQGLQDGTLALVSSDHAPYRFDDTGKLGAGADSGFHQIANGMPGLETRLPLMFDAMVSQGRGDLSAFARVTAEEPARIYGLERKGRIEEGCDADLVLWDPERHHTYGENDLHDNVGYNPFAGRTVKGWPERVYLRGQLLVEDGRFLGQPGQGAWLKRDRIGVAPTGTAAAEVRLIEDQSE